MSTLLRGAFVLAVCGAVSACSGGGSNGAATPDASDNTNGGSAGDASNTGANGGAIDGGGTNGSDGGDNSPGTNGSDAGSDGGTDAGMDAGTDGGTDAGADGGVDGGADGGVDGGPLAFSCPNAATTVTAAGGNVTSDDGHLTLSLGAGAVAQDTQLKVCAVPQADWPALVAADGAGPMGAVYQVEPLDLTFAASTSAQLTIQGATLAGITTVAGIEPLTLRRLSGAGAAGRLGSVVMQLLPQPLLTGTLAGGGQLYARQVDSSGPRYAVAVDTSATALSKLTGEVFDLGTKVTVSGTPSVTRSLSLVTRGCDLEPLQPLGVEQAHTQEPGCELEPVLREGTNLTLAGDQLASGAIDLTTNGIDVDATHVPPRFFCTHPGPAVASVHLTFGVGADRDVTVTATQDVTCTPSGDRLGAVEVWGANRNQHGPVVPTVWPRGTPLHAADVRIPTAATVALYEAFGSDGWYTSSATPQGSESLFDAGELATTGSGGAAINGVPVVFNDPSDSYIDGVYDNAASYRFYTDAGGTVTATGPTSGSVATDVTGFDQIDLRFGAPNNASTTLSFADNTVDVVLISGYDASSTLRFERWLRPSELPLSSGRRSTSILTAAQQQQLSTAGVTVTTYVFELLNVAWDESRAFWPAGRVLPVAGGHFVRLRADRIDPTTAPASPCPVAVTDGSNGCQTGPHETLLVATATGIQMFDPVTGAHLGQAFNGTPGDRNNFRHVVPGADGCLYASQNDDDNAGVYRYRPTTTGIVGIENDGTPYFDVDQPYGLGFVGTELLIGAGTGPVLSFNGTSPYNYGLNDVLRGHGLLVATGNLVMVASQAPALGSQSVVAVAPNDALAPFDLLTGLRGPEQIALDAADAPNVLIAETDGRVSGYRVDSSGLPQLQLLAHSAQVGSTPIEYSYAGAEAPFGIWPLLNDGQWLVAGEDMGVDVVMAGAFVKSAKGTTFTDDAYYISRACLPFDPTP